MTRYLTLAEFVWLAEQVTELDAVTIIRSSRLELADLFVDLNGGRWEPDPPDEDDVVDTVLAIAARELDESHTAAWLPHLVRFES